jgi:cytochrome P450
VIFFKKREDFIQSMLDHVENDENKKGKSLTNEEILSQAIAFFLAGYETVNNTLNFLAYCLATNTNHQETLCQEIDQILDKHVKTNHTN